MQNKLFFILILVLTLALTDVSAQDATEPSIPKTISGGVLNGKAANLPKPEYPAAALAVRASGAVNVQVTIDEQGSVISASAVSGHPLLRQAAEQAARQAKFNPTTLSGQPVKVTGVIVYNFVPTNSDNSTTVNKVSVTNWVMTGMLMSALEKMPSLRFFDSNSLKAIIPAEWNAERQQIERLDELKKIEMGMIGDAQPKERIIDNRMVTNQSQSPITVTTSTSAISPNRTASSESVAIAQSLISSISGRLGNEPLNLWNFQLGLNINYALDKADSRSKDERLNAAKTFRAFAETAPPEVSQESLEELKKMSSMIEKGIFTDEDKINLSQSMNKVTLSGLR